MYFLPCVKSRDQRLLCISATDSSSGAYDVSFFLLHTINNGSSYHTHNSSVAFVPRRLVSNLRFQVFLQIKLCKCASSLQRAPCYLSCLVNEIYGSVHTKLAECVSILKGVLSVLEICFLKYLMARCENRLRRHQGWSGYSNATHSDWNETLFVANDPTGNLQDFWMLKVRASIDTAPKVWRATQIILEDFQLSCEIQ